MRDRTKANLLLVAGVVIVIATLIYQARHRAPDWYAIHCHPPTVDRHGTVVVAAGDRWPCSEDNPLP